MTKDILLAALDKHVSQRPGLDYANYGDRTSYYGDLRPITRALGEYRTLARAVEQAAGITADDILEASKHAYSGRLHFHANQYTRADGNPVLVSYCTGQYYPTEYRAAACSVLASVLWSYIRASHPEYDGNQIRAHFRRWFGLGIQRRWFR
jgi:hypothetical protein